MLACMLSVMHVSTIMLTGQIRLSLLLHGHLWQTEQTGHSIALKKLLKNQHSRLKKEGWPSQSSQAVACPALPEAAESNVQQEILPAALGGIFPVAGGEVFWSLLEEALHHFWRSFQQHIVLWTCRGAALHLQPSASSVIKNSASKAFNVYLP